jgi:hypothetical protein
VTDLQTAKSFTERTATAVTFTVPDRDGDNIDETIRYAWAGTPGDPLTYQLNGGTATTLADDVQQFNLAALDPEMKAALPDGPPPESGEIVFHVEDYEEATPPTKKSTSGTTLAIPAPATIHEGDLLIAVVVRDAGGADLIGPWTNQLIVADGGGTTSTTVCVGVWWKIASGEPASYDFNIAQDKRAYGWIMRFSGHDADNPIHAINTDPGSSSAPNSPAVTTTVDNAMIVRIGGFDDDDINIDNTGIADHTTITMDESDSTSLYSCSGGAAYAMLPTAGDSGSTSFSLTSTEQFRTVTIAIAPEEAE